MCVVSYYSKTFLSEWDSNTYRNPSTEKSLIIDYRVKLYVATVPIQELIHLILSEAIKYFFFYSNFRENCQSH